MNLKIIGCGDVDLIHMPQDRVKSQIVVSTAMNVWVSEQHEIFWLPSEAEVRINNI
jgi:hypothetical protein